MGAVSAHPKIHHSLNKDNLCTWGEVDEITGGEDTFNAIDEIVLFQLEHITAHFAAIQLATCIHDHLQILMHWGHFQLLHLALHQGGGDGSHPRDDSHHLWDADISRHTHHAHLHAGIGYRGNFQMVHAVLADHVHSPEGEEDGYIDAITQGCPAHDHRRADHLQVTL